MVKKIPIEKICPVCGNHFIIAPWQERRGHKYCGQKCEYKMRVGRVPHNKKYFTSDEKEASKKILYSIWYAENRDIILTKKKERRSTPEAIEKEKIRRAKYFEDHKEEEKAYHKWYNIIFAEIIKERRKVYENTPKGRMARHRSIHKRRDRQLPVTLTLEQWNKIIKDQENECNLCRCLFTADNPPTQDHILPLAKGYGLTFENTQALCHACNSNKRDLLLPNFIQSWLS
jgi:hypothetical protein